MPERSVLLLAGEGPSTRMVYHALRHRLPAEIPVHVVLEAPVSRSVLVKRRIKRLGLMPVLGQLLFIAGVVPLLRARSMERVEEIMREHGLNDAAIPEPVHRVESVNSPDVQALLRSLSPAVVVVNGTRIIGKATLAATSAPFVNMHAGITPAYRGVHGGYWALAEGRPELVGTTIHRVDEGIDTGAVIDQAYFRVTSRDSFWTYPYLHTAAGLPLLGRAVEEILNGGSPARVPHRDLPSMLRYHPTAWGYLVQRLRRGAR